jgi:hypothetical protein
MNVWPRRRKTEHAGGLFVSEQPHLPHPTHLAARVTELHALGFTRAEIADHTGYGYAHVAAIAGQLGLLFTRDPPYPPPPPALPDRDQWTRSPATPASPVWRAAAAVRPGYAIYPPRRRAGPGLTPGT